MVFIFRTCRDVTLIVGGTYYFCTHKPETRSPSAISLYPQSTIQNRLLFIACPPMRLVCNPGSIIQYHFVNLLVPRFALLGSSVPVFTGRREPRKRELCCVMFSKKSAKNSTTLVITHITVNYKKPNASKNWAKRLVYRMDRNS